MGTVTQPKRKRRADSVDEPEKSTHWEDILRDREEYWTRLIMSIADGNASNYHALMRMDITEFYYLYRVHVESVERIKGTGRKPNF